ncbi:MAG TPA: hypothetical protein VLC28_10880 [Flavitalea sp.]|nr:hypothetical protein [Flavitalea sp.]
MLRLSILIFALATISGCSKSGSAVGKKVDIYLLKSFTRTLDTSRQMGVILIEDAVLEDQPLVKNSDILFYERSTSTFKLLKNIQPQMDTLDSFDAFAVTVDGEPVYYGTFHPIYLSSILYGSATINPNYMENNRLKIDFAYLETFPFISTLDKRNDPRIIDAFSGSGRLR